jgi:hypothetical protein
MLLKASLFCIQIKTLVLTPEMVNFSRIFSLTLLSHGLYRFHGEGIKPFLGFSRSEDEDGGY